MLDRAIVLVGPAGVGKTTVGKKLASSLGKTFIDTDSLFVKDHGEISEFFNTHGESAFRALEEDYLQHALIPGAVVATGGGIVLSARNREQLKNAIVIYLATDGTHMAKRISQGNRPLLRNGIEDWKRLYSQRKALYEQIADITIDCSGHPIRQSVTEIRQALAAHE